MTVVVLGCGYTGVRVAERFLHRGTRVIATSRNAAKLVGLAAKGAEVIALDLSGEADNRLIPKGALVVYSIPHATEAFIGSLEDRPARLVHISTTGVYGPAAVVDHNTPPQPREERERDRLAQEEIVKMGGWSTLILRSPAIYGPGRGVHASLLRGEFRLAGKGSNYVSRIHVDDLASHVEAGLLSELRGTYPVADNEPCTSREIAEYCSRLLGVVVPESVPASSLHHTRNADRRVEGSEIRRLLGVQLRYPTYREGIPASLNISVSTLTLTD